MPDDNYTEKGAEPSPLWPPPIVDIALCPTSFAAILHTWKKSISNLIATLSVIVRATNSLFAVILFINVTQFEARTTPAYPHTSASLPSLIHRIPSQRDRFIEIEFIDKWMIFCSRAHIDCNTLLDPIFGLSAPAAQLFRSIHLYDVLYLATASEHVSSERLNNLGVSYFYSKCSH